MSGAAQKLQSGKVYLIGAGPGDTGLITMKGIEALKEADVVVYDHLASPSLLNERRMQLSGSMQASSQETTG